MAEVVLFHHALGLTPGMVDFADVLRGDGHAVHAPDLLDGRTFATLPEAMRHVETIGFDRIIDIGTAAVDGLPDRLVYLGFSLGVLPAQKLAQTRPGARGAVLAYSCVPATEFGARWPTGVPVQIHGMQDDPIFSGEGDLDAARDIAATTEDAELFLYPGDQHYFADPTLPSYDPIAGPLLQQRVRDFVNTR